VTTSNWIELALIIVTLAISIPGIIKLKKAVKDIYGFKGIVKKADSEGETVIKYAAKDDATEDKR
jgi:Sec-independent protein translocase protein TatA